MDDITLVAWWELLQARQRTYAGDWRNLNDYTLQDRNMPETNATEYRRVTNTSAMMDGFYRQCVLLTVDFKRMIIKKREYKSRNKQVFLDTTGPCDSRRSDSIFLPVHLGGTLEVAFCQSPGKTAPLLRFDDG